MVVAQMVTILGATGSIGTQTLDVIRHNRDAFAISALTTHERVSELKQMIREFDPLRVVVHTKEQCDDVLREFPKVEVLWGDDAYQQVASADSGALVVNALVGSMGIKPTLEAISAGCDVALANKETLVAAGDLVMQEAKTKGVSIIPVDSEHSAIAQCLLGYQSDVVQRLILTASGGPFRTYSQEELHHVTIGDALAHPTWRMGPKITVDSATLMNKGLEVIEAHYLFATPYDAIDVIVHPQSIIHSLVEFRDGALLAQLGAADMRVPIQFALFQGRTSAISPFKRLDLSMLSQLTFETPDLERFPALSLAYDCGKAGGTFPAVMNAANEIAASAFLRDEIAFLEIFDVVARVVDKHRGSSALSMDDVFAADAWARRTAMELVCERGRNS